MNPLSFQPRQENIDTVSLDTHNKVLEELAAVQNELMRCRQKVAHLLKEKEPRAAVEER